VLVAAIADTHLPRGARRLPPACVERLRAADLILHAGDVVGVDVLRALQGLGPPLHAVHGNVDDAEVRRLLPERTTVEAGGARIGLVHVPGPRKGREERLVRRFPGCDAVLYGHTHVPQVDRHEGVWILNPGSPTERRRAPGHTMLVLAIDGGRIEPELVALDP
jgi:putative phosphoesterase